jgi:hypothetical protein
VKEIRKRVSVKPGSPLLPLPLISAKTASKTDGAVSVSAEGPFDTDDSRRPMPLAPDKQSPTPGYGERENGPAAGGNLILLQFQSE